jgi:hypothetical protein
MGLFVSDWSLSPAVATLLLADAGLSVPQPFEPSVPYTTVTGRERLRASASVDVDLRQTVTAFGNAPVALIALGEVDGTPLGARACWGSAAVLVTQDKRGWRFARRKSTALFRALAALTPDTPAAGGVPVTVAGGRNDSDDPLAQPPLLGTRDTHLVERILEAPVVHSGMFIPVRDGEPQPAVHWRDTRAEGSAHVVRHVITSRIDARGTRWLTYTPGDRSHVAAALRDAVTPLLCEERTPHE